MTALLQSHSLRSDGFVPGSSGWTVADLDDPTIERIWEQEHYEIIEGVLAAMPAAYYEHGYALGQLIRLVFAYLDSHGKNWGYSGETDLILSPTRIVKPDALFLSPEDTARQKAMNAKRGKTKMQFGRLLVPPSLIIESISNDHQLHDEVTKRRWYAEAGVPNYWLLNAYAKTLQCLILEEGKYRLDAAGKGTAKVKPAAFAGLFAGLVIPLKTLWA